MVVDDRVEVDSGQELEAEFDGGSRSYSRLSIIIIKSI